MQLRRKSEYNLRNEVVVVNVYYVSKYLLNKDLLCWYNLKYIDISINFH